MANNDPDLIREDPESEACFDLMVAIIAEEIRVRLALGDDGIDDPAWVERVSELVADALLMRLRVEERTPASPRYRWQEQGQDSRTPDMEP